MSSFIASSIGAYKPHVSDVNYIIENPKFQSCFPLKLQSKREDDLHNVFGEFGEIKNLLTGFVKGYALIEYENFAKAQAAISRMDGDSIPTHNIVNVDWASSESFLDGSKKKNTSAAIGLKWIRQSYMKRG